MYPPSQSYGQGGLHLPTSLFLPGTENLHLIFSYSVWVLRDFPEDGLKVGYGGLLDLSSTMLGPDST